MRILIFPAIDADRLTRLRAVAPDIEFVNAEDEAAAATAVVDADALFGRLTPDLLSRATRLQWVQSPTASLEHYVFPALVEHPLTLTNMRGLFSDVIADHVFGLILCFARNLHHYIRRQAEHRWAPVGGEAERSTFLAGPGVVNAIDRQHRHMADQTLGIVGLGGIGREIARRGKAFGMRVLAVDPHPERACEAVDQVTSTDHLESMLTASDFVVVAAPHTPQTAGMFRRAQLCAIGAESVLINIGRGALVILDDLVACLQAGELGGAALDVFEIEPLPAEHPLWEMPNVILTPHVAGTSPRIAERHFEVVADNVKRFARGEPLRNVVNKAEWY